MRRTETTLTIERHFFDLQSGCRGMTARDTWHDQWKIRQSRRGYLLGIQDRLSRAPERDALQLSYQRLMPPHKKRT
jgi:hypothetical protein